jgi:hypothetical protein
MNIRWHPGQPTDHQPRLATERAGQNRTPEQVEHARRRALRVFLQTAVGTAVIGGVLLVIAHGTLQPMAAFLLAWSAGWFSASAFLHLQRLLARVRRSRKP